METWRKAVNELSRNGLVEIYPDSVHRAGESIFFITRIDDDKKLVVYGYGDGFSLLNGKETAIGEHRFKICEMDNTNAKTVRELFPFTSPVSCEGRNTSIGLGDRLGMASPGHIRLLKDSDVFPVIAQQSIRELNLTGRTFDDVLAAATWAVFQEGYKDGYGADGDHLKTPDEVRMALNSGFTMITLDCSDFIDNNPVSLSGEEVDSLYRKEISEEDREALENRYTGRELSVGEGLSLSIEETEYKRTVLVYYRAVRFAARIYNDVIKQCGKKIDFELSIDETSTPTTPEAHYFVASELTNSGVNVSSLAPRFCGEFQKAIDYRGDTSKFSAELKLHFRIAEHFGYRLSIHSGSDKFSVFPIIGRITGGRFHLKTAGTNWLEAVRIIAAKNTLLYRKMHILAVKSLPEVKKYYHIYTQPEMVPDIEGLRDEALTDLMDNDEARQALHVSYGPILQEKNSEGIYVLRDEFYGTLQRYEMEYYEALKRHIGKHLSLLGISFDKEE